MMMSTALTSPRMVPSRPSACEDLLEQVADLGPQRDGLLVDGDGAAVQRKDQVVAGGDCLLEEMFERCGRGLVAVERGARVVKDEVVGAQCERCEQLRACRIMAIHGAHSDARLGGDGGHRHPLALAPDGDRRGSQNALAVGYGIAAQGASATVGFGDCPRHLQEIRPARRTGRPLC
jgi:hypothetical protein